MIDQIFSLANSLKEKQIPPLLRRILNVTFVGGITSYLFTRFYFEYDLLNPLDYNANYKFFVEGEFIIPAAIFFITWVGTTVISHIIFRVPSYWLSNKIRAAIINFSLATKLSDEQMNEIKNEVSKIQSIPFDNVMLALHQEIKKSVTAKELAGIRKGSERLKSNIENDAKLLVRAFLAIVCYFITIPFFGWILLTILVIASIVAYALLFIGYQLADIFPIFIDRVLIEMNSYVEKIKSMKSNKNNNVSSTL